MSRPIQFLAAALVLLLAGCAPLYSKYPLGKRASDSELVGVWGYGDAEIRVARSGRNQLSLIYTVLEGASEIEMPSLYFTVLTSRIDRKRFMSVKQTFPEAFVNEYAKAEGLTVRQARQKLSKRDRRMNGYYLGFYEIVEEEGIEQLTFYLIDEENEIVATALESGVLKGHIIQVRDEDDTETSILYLTSSTRDLTTFVSGHTENPTTLFDLPMSDALLRTE